MQNHSGKPFYLDTIPLPLAIATKLETVAKYTTASTNLARLLKQHLSITLTICYFTISQPCVLLIAKKRLSSGNSAAANDPTNNNTLSLVPVISQRLAMVTSLRIAD